MKKYNLIFLDNGKVLLSKSNYATWQQIQHEYEQYSTSVGFDSLDDLNQYLSFDYQLDIDHIASMTNEIERTSVAIELQLQ